MAASQSRVALMPTSSSQLNVTSAERSSTKKRKRSTDYDTNARGSLFTAKAVSSRQRPETCAFTPLTTIARTNLPLAWLDPSQTQAQVPPGYVFRTNILLLHENHDNVLVARLCPNGRLYAIDNATETTYTAWPLINWVSAELCCNAAQGNTVLPALEQLIHDDGHHSRTTSVSGDVPTQAPTPRSPKQAKNRRGAIARMSILTPKDPCESQPSTNDSCLSQSLADTPRIVQDDSASNTSALRTSAILEGSIPRLDELLQVQKPTTSTDELLSLHSKMVNPEISATFSASAPEPYGAEPLLQQYFDTLYLSKASLAFWAKGPLSRARAQARKPEAGFGLEALKESYLAMVLPTKKIDLKYKESISKAVKDFIARKQEIPDAPKPAKPKQPPRNKLAKNCLYAGEDEVIVKWWTERNTKRAMTTSVSVHEDDLRTAVSELRNRETEMQLLFILEVLYINILLSKVTDGAVASPSPAIKVESVREDNATLPTRPAPTKRKRDLYGELDVNAERLSIWHTVALGDILASPEKALESSHSTTSQSKDRLRDFCRDVIIPFYSVKVPEQAKSICRKFGGPEISPQRPRSYSGKSTVRPVSSAGAREKPQAVLKRSLQRVLSEDQTVRCASPPILSRSSTLSNVPKLERELSESDGRLASRSGMQKSVSFSNREIDLIADAKAHETRKRKLDKLATQKKELEEAIDALKKPNRTNAAKSFMDEIESRTTDARMGAIHIAATPRRAKHRSSSSAMAAESQSQIPSIVVGEAGIVPSSTIKPAHAQPTLGVPASSKKKRAVLSAIYDTPSRGLSKLANPLAMIQATPAVDRLRPDLATDTPLRTRNITKSGKPVLFTPMRRKDVNAENEFLFRDASEIPENAGKAMDRVMGGKGIEETLSFELKFNDPPQTQPHISVRTGMSMAEHSSIFGQSTEEVRLSKSSTSAEEKSIYEALGWDDFDDV